MNVRPALLLFLFIMIATRPCEAQDDRTAELELLPEVASGFEITLWAKEPLVRNPCAMAFDAKGRICVGMGPQYRNPTPQTPPDSVVILTDADGNGVAETRQVFATGFNCIQSLAWRGGDLWVANAPDLTIVRDLDGDDAADEYVRVFTDLGNIEHALHGLNWAPDGRLYMSKGNSKGLMQPGRIAPKPFRDLAGMTAPPGTPDLPPPQTFLAADYRRTYQDPRDDWGREGGVLRCESDGTHLEIVARGLRNPWDIAFNDTFDWLGTDNDQNEGDRFFMPFIGAHFGWGHVWSANWTGAGHLPTTPISGPVFPGSGTGVVWSDPAAWPASHRGVFLVNDWLLKKTYVYRPRWNGALMEPAIDPLKEELVRGGKSLFRPTDLEFGPDGALYILGWGRSYGLIEKHGEQQNEGRIYRVIPQGAAAYTDRKERSKPLSTWTFEELSAEFTRSLPVWRIDAGDELVRRGAAVQNELRALLARADLPVAQRTWALWTLGRILPEEAASDEWFLKAAATDPNEVRILGDRARRSKREPHGSVVSGLKSQDARLRLAAVLALRETRSAVPALIELMANETDRLTFHAAWGALGELLPGEELRLLARDSRDAVRRGALLALLERRALSLEEAAPFTRDRDTETARLAALFLGKTEPLPATAGNAPGPLRMNLTGLLSRSPSKARVSVGGLHVGAPVYSDRNYKLTRVPELLAGSTFIQMPNSDAGSTGDDLLSFDLPMPATLFIAHDRRIAAPPKWMALEKPDGFKDSDLVMASSDATFRLWQKDFPAGRVTLGGNTEDGKERGRSNYIVVVKAAPLALPREPATAAGALAALKDADPKRGEWLFAGENGAHCWRCHREGGDGLGPVLTGIGQRGDAESLIRSILDPNAVITEGFGLLNIETRDGKTFSGVMREETDTALTLARADGPPQRIEKASIAKRESLHVSPMPPFGSMLDARQVADLTAYLLTLREAPIVSAGKSESGGFECEQRDDRVVITRNGKPVAHYIFRDANITRPFFAHLHEPGGAQVTRNFPPIAGRDFTDHATMHPGVWFAWGDINGADFWRNRASIRHERFLEAPSVKNDRVTFVTESSLGVDASKIGTLLSRYAIRETAGGWLIEWDATIVAGEKELRFGDQEEMCFAVRLATPLSETRGGFMVNDT
ncbi:MAG: PVC-type heme-binding CxxCH protein, partial [Verrucomicrobiota bacterium]